MLSEHGGDAKVLAGGQSLVPMLNFRLLKPSALVDINQVKELDFVSESETGIRIGALTRHRTLESSPKIAAKFPIIPAAMRHVAHLAIRNRGTIGGSLSHADPAAELPLLATLLDARIKTKSAKAERTLTPAEFFLGALTTALEEDEIVCEIELPNLPEFTCWGFEEVAQRSGDFAMAAAAVTLTFADDRCVESRIAVIGADTAIRVAAAEAILRDVVPDAEAIGAAARAASEAAEWNEDLHASRELRKKLVETTTRRALEAANAKRQRVPL